MHIHTPLSAINTKYQSHHSFKCQGFYFPGFKQELIIIWKNMCKYFFFQRKHSKNKTQTKGLLVKWSMWKKTPVVFILKEWTLWLRSSACGRQENSGSEKQSPQGVMAPLLLFRNGERCTFLFNTLAQHTAR